MLKLKESIKENLEENFINDMKSIKKEMKLLNLLLASFTEKNYDYNEYCRLRIKFEVEACDFVDFDYNEEMEMSDQERLIIQNRAVGIIMSNPNSVYEEIVEEESVKWQLEKCFRLDKRMYSQIYETSTLNLIKEKVSAEVWKEKYKYFEDICKDKAETVGESIAQSKQEMHEQEIRSSLM